MEVSQDTSEVGDSEAAMNQLLEVKILQSLPENYRLRHPVRVLLRRSETCYLVTSDTHTLHGVGSTPDEAVEDFEYALLDYYDTLDQNRGRLAPHLQAHLDQLDELIEYKPARG